MLVSASATQGCPRLEGTNKPEEISILGTKEGTVGRKDCSGGAKMEAGTDANLGWDCGLPVRHRGHVGKVIYSRT